MKNLLHYLIEWINYTWYFFTKVEVKFWFDYFGSCKRVLGTLVPLQREARSIKDPSEHYYFLRNNINDIINKHGNAKKGEG